MLRSWVSKEHRRSDARAREVFARCSGEAEKEVTTFVVLSDVDLTLHSGLDGAVVTWTS